MGVDDRARDRGWKPSGFGEQVAEAAREEQRANDEHERHGDLRDHQCATQAQALVIAGHAASCRLFSASPGAPREARSAGVRPRSRQVGERRGRQKAQTRQSGVSVSTIGSRLVPISRTSTWLSAWREEGRGDGARRRDDDALAQQLRNEPAARRAEREPQRQLALPDGAAREHQVREVGAGDQQHEAGHREQQPQRRRVAPRR